MGEHYPAVQITGRMEQTIAEHVRRAELLIAEEQEKPLPNNALIACLCDSVRLSREQMSEAANGENLRDALENLLLTSENIEANFGKTWINTVRAQFQVAIDRARSALTAQISPAGTKTAE